MRIKKWLSALLSAAMLLGTMAVPVFAEETTVSTDAELQSVGQNGGSIKLGNDIIISGTVNVKIQNDLTIDLNGHSIDGSNKGYALTVDNGTLTVNNSGSAGTITGYFNGIRCNKGNVIINGGTVKGNTQHGIYNKSGDSRITVNGGHIIGGGGGSKDIGIYNNGTVTVNGGIITGEDTGIYNNSVVTVNGGTIEGTGDGGWGIALITGWEPSTLTMTGGTVTGVAVAVGNNGDNDTPTEMTIGGGTVYGGGCGIYHPGEGTLIISDDAAITSRCEGIEMRAGTLNMSGGRVESTVASSGYKANGSGNTVYGAGIAVSQHTTKLPISVNISGGVINANVPLCEVNAQGNTADDLSKISLNISGGNFETKQTGEPYSWAGATSVDSQAVYVADTASIATPTFITNGTFSTEPHKYVKVNYASKKLDTSDVYNVIPLSQLVPNLNGELTIKSAIDNEKYEQVTAVMTTVNGETKDFNVTTSGIGDTQNVNKTITLKEIGHYDGTVLCGLVIKNIPQSVTVTITAE